MVVGVIDTHKVVRSDIAACSPAYFLGKAQARLRPKAKLGDPARCDPNTLRKSRLGDLLFGEPFREFHAKRYNSFAKTRQHKKTTSILTPVEWRVMDVLSYRHGMPRRRSKKSVPHFLREWRDYRRLTQPALAAKAGLSNGMVSHLETGRNLLTETTLTVLAKALNCTPGDILDIDPQSRSFRAKALFESLSPEEQEQALRLMRALVKDSA